VLWCAAVDVVCIWGATAADSGRGAMFIRTYLWIFDQSPPMRQDDARRSFALGRCTTNR
jgi:hypothetical protein